MLIDDKKVLFIHIPKTGGQAVSNVLFEGGFKSLGVSKEYLVGHKPRRTLTHITYSEVLTYLNRSPEDFDDYFKFSIVRNPWSRAVSLWAARFKEKGYSFQESLDFIEEGNLKIFDECFANSYLGKVMTKPQSDYVLHNGKISVDIYKFENYKKEIKKIKKRLGIKRRLYKINSSKHSHYSHYYNKKRIKQVERIYGKDIDLFGYRFNT